jgi:perosamine synthetase
MSNKLKYPISEPYLSGNEREYLINAFDSGWISSKGEYIEKFENSFARFTGMRSSISCSNGTTALHLAVKALNIGRGDEVIVPNLTFASPANAVLYEGGKLVLVDINKDYWGIDPDQLESFITPKTRAIIAVHLYGHPCDMDEIMRIAKTHDLSVIEDCAEAPGALYKGKPVGTFGDIGCFSFYGNKIITTGEGGMVVTNNDTYSTRIRKLRDHGMTPEKRYWHDEIGYNYRITNLQAAIGYAQLENIEKLIEKKRNIAKLYSQTVNEDIVIQKEMEWANNVFWLPTFILNTCKNKECRDLIIKKMLEIGIETRPTFFPLNEMPPYKTNGVFQNSYKVANLGISLPSLNTMTEEDVFIISESINKLIRK